MKILFLGTGTSTGIPMIGCSCEVCTSNNSLDKRLRTSIYIETNGVKLVIDTGPDFRQQMLREKIDDLDLILFTHPHKDHVAGLDDIRPINHLKNKVIDAYSNQITLDRLKLEFPYIFENDYPGVPQIKFHLIDKRRFTFKDLNIAIIKAMHGSMPVLGFKINNLAYLTDLNSIEQKEVDLIMGIDCLIVSALHHKKHYSHFTLEEALAFVGLVKPKQAYLIHMSHRMGKHVEVEKILPKNVHLSYDGLTITL